MPAAGLGLGSSPGAVAEEGDEIPYHHQPVSLWHRTDKAGQLQLRLGLGNVLGLPRAPAVRASTTEDAVAQPARVIAAVEHREPESPVAFGGGQPQLEVRLVLQPGYFVERGDVRFVPFSLSQDHPDHMPDCFPVTEIVSSLVILVAVISPEAGMTPSSTTTEAIERRCMRTLFVTNASARIIIFVLGADRH